jgi:hypothetical protein
MAIYGPVRHQKNIIWTEACPYNIFSSVVLIVFDGVLYEVRAYTVTLLYKNKIPEKPYFGQ